MDVSMRRILIILLWCIVAFSAQPSCQSSPKQAGQSGKQTVSSKLTLQQERGLRLLQAAESEAAGLAPDMGAFVLWRVSYAYAKVDLRKSESVAKDAFIESLAIESSSDNSSDAQCGSEGGAGGHQELGPGARVIGNAPKGTDRENRRVASASNCDREKRNYDEAGQVLLWQEGYLAGGIVSLGVER